MRFCMRFFFVLITVQENKEDVDYAEMLSTMQELLAQQPRSSCFSNE